MQKQQALDLMKSSKTVKEWNANRLKVQTQSTQSEWEELHKCIDAYGLIVEVLGKDNPRAQVVEEEKDLEVTEQ